MMVVSVVHPSCELVLMQGALTKDAFPPDVIEAYKYTFSQPGALTAPINYYRCMLKARKGDKDVKKNPYMTTASREDHYPDSCYLGM